MGLRILAGVLAVVLLCPASSFAQSWVPSWTASLYQLGADARLRDDQITNTTLRQAIRLSVGGRRIKIVLSNVAGTEPLKVGGVHVAISGPPGSASIQPQSDREARFDDRPDVIVPAGGTVVSDAIELSVAPLARLSVSIYFALPPKAQSGHLRSLSSSWVAQGNQLSEATLSAAESVEHWYQLAAVQVETRSPRVIVAFGDSITDGSRSRPNANARWPDLLAERLQRSSKTNSWAVVNAGLAGNELLADGFGPSAFSRFDRDVLSQPHVRSVILLEGINDLGQFARTAPDAAARNIFRGRMIGAYQQLIARAHGRGIRIIGATLLPYGGSDYHPSALDESERQAINEWIRTPGHFDAVIDWDAVMRDSGDPSRLRAEFDSGDHIHPSALGYGAMAEAVPIGEIGR